MVDKPGGAGLGGPRQRRLLAALLADHGRLVSTDRLAEVVFAGEPTDAAAATLRTYVTRLRRTLGGHDATIETETPGYRLHIGSSTIDAELFEDALFRSRTLRTEGRVAEALDAVAGGLDLWRGPAYAEFADEEWIAPEAIRLDGLRVDAEEIRLACLLDLGRHDEVVPALSAFAERHPLREPVRLLLITALYRAGRQADALRAADAYRGALADIGLEPTEDLERLEDRVVSQDPDLRLTPPSGRHLRGYRVIGRLGGDDRVEIHTALQPGIERLVAVTSYSAAVADHPAFIREFETRVREVARVEHPGLVEILDFWREPGSGHLVTRLARGGSLAELLEKGPLGADTVAPIILQAAGALAEAHTHGLWHGSLTPDDLLFDEDGSIRVAGVGISEIVEAITSPPDVLESSGPAADQLSLARITQHALTGFDAHQAGTGLRVSGHRPELLALDGVLARAAAPNHADRYTDITAFARSFADAIGADTPAAVTAPRINPYKGLRPFRETDSGDFFGREAMVTELVTRIGTERFVTVVGGSGSGKSSLVLAGVVPRIRAVRHGIAPLVATMVPGPSPFDELTRALRSVVPLDRGAGLDAAVDGVRRTVVAGLESDTLILVVDQLEELWTLVDDPTERSRFITGLMDAVEDERLGLHVVATLRADFFDRPLQHHRLGDAVAVGAVGVAAMSPAEIERAIVEPAAAAGVAVERAVVVELVADVVDQPSGLPLLQFSLTELFAACDGDTITMADLERLGGVAGAISQRAERLHRDATEAERQLIKAMLLRLVTVGEGAPDLRRRAARSELLSASPDPVAMERVLDRFGAARLLTFDRNPHTREPTVEVAHEALLRHWPRLRSWVEEAGQDLTARAHLTSAAAGWEATGREQGELYRGARLAAVALWLDRTDLTDAERDFLHVSLEARAEEEEAAQRQLELQMDANRRLRRSLAAVGVVLIVALVAGFLAVSQRNRARTETVRAEETLGRQLATMASERVGVDRSLALLLAVEASRLDASVAVHRGLLDALGGTGLPFTRTAIPTPADDYVALAVSADGQTAVAKRAEGSIDVIDLGTRRVTVAGLPGPASPFGGIDISDDGSLVLVAGSGPDGAGAVIRRLPDGAELGRIDGRAAGLHSAVFVPESDEVIVTDAAGIMTVHTAETGRELRRVDTGRGLEITTLAATSSTVYIVELSPGVPEASWVTAWDILTGERLAGPTPIGDGVVVQVAVAGNVVVTAGQRIRAFDATTLEPLGEEFRGSSEGDLLFGLAVSPDGLVAAGSFNNLELWGGLGSPDGPMLLTSGGSAVGAAFSPDGATLVTADPDGAISTRRVGWVDDIGTALEPAGPGLVTVSPAGDVLAVWGRGRGLQLFDRASLAHLGGVEGLGPEDSFLGVSFSPDGGHVATLTCPADLEEQDCPAMIEVFDAATRRRVLGPSPAGPVWWLVGNVLAYTADGASLAVGSAAAEVRLFQATTLRQVDPPLLMDELLDAPGRLLAVATGIRDGRSVLAAVNDLGQVAIWDTTDTPQPIGAIRIPSFAATFGPGGELYVGTIAGPVQAWDPLTLEPLGATYRASAGAWRIRVASGVLLVSANVGGTELFDLETTRPLSGTLPSWAADLDIDGRRVFLGGIGFDQGGAEVRALPLDIESLVAEACHYAGRNLTPEEWASYMPADVDHRATCPDWPLPGDGTPFFLGS
ncbi:MAG TPA: BTAD domain-containing putative transcriptional regulator [Acidimicrobiia bacterium]|nr:BTAD domain-containing putative transcriptional regulator [Acidimicrobiia bacterium]